MATLRLIIWGAHLFPHTGRGFEEILKQRRPLFTNRSWRVEEIWEQRRLNWTRVVAFTKERPL